MRSFILQLFPRKNYDAIPAAVAGFIIILIFARHSGIGVSPDSVVYMSVARNIAHHGYLLDFNARPLVVFPAFYPFFLSALMLITGKDVMQFGPVLDGVLFAIIIYVSGWIMEKFTMQSRWYKLMILTCLVFSPCLLEIYSMIWSETLFIFLLLLFFIALRYYLFNPTIDALLMVSAIAAFACVTRYAGVTIVGTGGMMIFLNYRLPFLKKIRHSFIFGLTGISLLSLNILRNVRVDATATGMREKSLTNLQNNIFYYGNQFCDWLPVPEDHFWFSFFIGIIIIVISALVVCRSYVKKTWHSFENIAASFFLLYSVFIIVSATISRYEAINNRLLSPLFIPFIWTISAWVVPVFRKGSIKIRLATAAIFVTGFLVFQYGQYKTNQDNYEGIKDAGIPGYTEDPWNVDSEIVNFLRTHKNLFKPEFNTYSNADDALYFYTNLRCDMIPHRMFPKEISDFYIENNCYLVWFNDTDNPELIALQDILLHKKMTVLYQFSNGTIYVTADPGIAVKNR